MSVYADMNTHDMWKTATELILRVFF